MAHAASTTRSVSGPDRPVGRDGSAGGTSAPQASPGRPVAAPPQFRERGPSIGLNRRGRIILGVAVVVTVVVNAGVAWAYLSLRDRGSAVAVAGTVVEVSLQARSDDRGPLHPGDTADLTVTVTNRNPFAVRILSVSPGAGAVTADSAHRAGGCRSTGVVVATEVLDVSWEVPRNTIGVFMVPGGLRMTDGSDPACRGAIFTVPITATVVGDAP